MSANTDSESAVNSEDQDEYWMRQALRLAIKGQGYVEPNPMVGCVLVRRNECIGKGYHHRYGESHAEVDALASLNSSIDARDATAYVTLEPCCHVGKTPPCTNALINSGVRRVVVAMRDPFPAVDGGGIKQLLDAGIAVTQGVLENDAMELNAPYLKRIRTGMPWVIAKWAMTPDGRIATVIGESQWITGQKARMAVHELRGRVDAILVGTGTVQSDDPLLTARLFDSDGHTRAPQRTAQRVVFCRRKLPSSTSKLVATASEVPTWLFIGSKIRESEIAAFGESNVRVTRLDTEDDIEMVSLGLQRLGEEGMTNVMLEGGPGLIGSFIDPNDSNSLIDEYHVYLGSKLFGGASAPGPIGGSGLREISQAIPIRLRRIDQFDDDVRLVYMRDDT